MFGPILRDWQERGGVQQHVRVKAITIVLIAVVTTIVVSGYEPVRSIAVSALAVIGIAVVLRASSSQMTDCLEEPVLSVFHTERRSCRSFPCLRDDVFNDVAVDVGEAVVATGVVVGELLVVEAHQFHDGGL